MINFERGMFRIIIFLYDTQGLEFDGFCDNFEWYYKLLEVKF